MGHVIAHVEIEDYEKFIATFGDRGQRKRAEYGCRGVAVHRDTEDPNRLVNVFDWDREDLERFMADPEVSEIMQEAGLKRPPTYTWVERMVELEA